MSVKKEPSGRRSVQVEIEVPGTPEEVWRAIATGPGVSAWFVPTDVEERDGKPVSVTSHFGPGMDSVATVTAWEPPHRFAAEDKALGPAAPPVATEWIVEARGGGRCVVRVVHSLFASTDEWDNQLESWENGWPWFFHILLSYLTEFRGEPCFTMNALGGARAPESKAWEAMAGSLGVAGATVGQRCVATAEAPPLAGRVELVQVHPGGHGVLVRLDQPHPGLASLFTHTAGDQVLVVTGFYLYGQRAAAVAARDEPLWRAWMSERFPAPGDMSCSG